MQTLDEVLAKHGPLPLYTPDGQQAYLEPMQIEDINRLAQFGRTIGDLPVGYGKTAIATCVALMLEPALTLILVPPVLIDQWVAWLKSIRNIGPVTSYEGSPAKRKAIKIEEYDFLVMSFGTFRNDHQRFVKVCGDANVCTIIDEAQNLKNYQSKLFQYVRQLSDGRDLLLMSGTLMSSPADAYSYIKLTNSPAYASFQQFKNIHVAEEDFWGQPKKWQNLDLMQQNLNLRRVRRTKEEVHSMLPKANVIPVYYDLDKKHMALYDQLMNEQLLLLDDGSKIDATTANALYHAAQQIITHWGFYAGDDTLKSKVFDLIDGVCDEIGFGGQDEDGSPASKLILWTQYKRTSAAVHAYMDAKARKLGGYSTAAYSEVNTRAMVGQFMSDSKALDLVAQPGSAGAGLNPQAFCWECAFIETPTRTIHFTQAAGRIDRKGQRFNPNIRIFIARGTIQQRLFQQLLTNDDLVTQASGTVKGIRSLIFPE